MREVRDVKEQRHFSALSLSTSIDLSSLADEMFLPPPPHGIKNSSTAKSAGLLDRGYSSSGEERKSEEKWRNCLERGRWMNVGMSGGLSGVKLETRTEALPLDFPTTPANHRPTTNLMPLTSHQTHHHRQQRRRVSSHHPYQLFLLVFFFFSPAAFSPQKVSHANKLLTDEGLSFGRHEDDFERARQNAQRRNFRS